MNVTFTSSPGQDDRNLQLFSELSILHAAVGAGLRLPFKRVHIPGIVGTSAVSQDFMDTFSSVEQTLRKHLRQQRLEQEASESPGDQSDHSEAPVDFALWRSPTSDRSTFVQIVSKARFRHVMYLDATGSRFSLKMMLPQSAAAEAGLLSLTQANCLDTELVRSSATGGSKIYAVNHEGESAPLSYVSLADSRTISAVCDRIHKKPAYGPWIGRLVPVTASPGAHSAVQADAKLMTDMFRTFFINGQSEQTVLDCVLEDPGLQSVWQAFIDGHGVHELLGIPISRRHHFDTRMQTSPCAVTTAAAFATRAAVTLAALEHAALPIERRPMHVRLTSEHFNTCKSMFAAIMNPELTGEARAAKVHGKLEKARAAKAALAEHNRAERESTALAELTQAIHTAEHKMISRRTATRLPGVNTSLLDALVKNGRVIEVVGRDNIQLHCTERAYTLPGLTQIASGETVNEIEMARREQRECPGVPGELRQTINFLHYELPRLAAQYMDQTMFPAIPASALTPGQVRALAWLEAERPGDFCVRMPNEEKPHLQRTPEDPDAPLDPEMAHVWVRRDIKGKDFRDWKLAARLGFAERWASDWVVKAVSDTGRPMKYGPPER